MSSKKREKSGRCAADNSIPVVDSAWRMRRRHRSGMAYGIVELIVGPQPIECFPQQVLQIVGCGLLYGAADQFLGRGRLIADE